MGNPDQPLHIQTLLGDAARRVQGPPGPVVFLGWNQPQMSLRKGEMLHPRHDAQNGDMTILFDGPPCHGRMTFSSHAVEDHTPDIHFRIERLAP